MICTITLNPAIDYVVQLPGSLAPGQINRSLREDYQYGGKGINVSHVLKTLGHDSTVLGFVAGQTGDWLEAGVREMGLNAQFLRTGGMTRINVKVNADEETEINGTGPQITEADLAALQAQLSGLGAGDILVLSGSVPGCLPGDTYARLLAPLEGRNIRIVADTSGPALAGVLPCHPFLVKPNREELEALFDTTLHTDGGILACARKMQEMGARNVLVSLGPDGALLLDETGKSYRIRSPEGIVVNSVGAGDSMVAGFLAGWLETGSFEYALKLGTAAGSATAFSLGLADRNEIYGILNEMT